LRISWAPVEEERRVVVVLTFPGTCRWGEREDGEDGYNTCLGRM